MFICLFLFLSLFLFLLCHYFYQQSLGQRVDVEESSKFDLNLALIHDI